MIAAGSSLSFDVRGVAGGWTGATEDATRSAIIAELSKTFLVEQCTINAQGSFYELFEWEFLAHVIVRTRGAYGNVDGPRSIVTNAVYVATGNMPTVGEAGSQGPADDGSFIDTITGGLRDTVSAVTGEFNFVLIAVAVVALVLIVSVGGKNTRVGVSGLR